jgi:hypothetical protein
MLDRAITLDVLRTGDLEVLGRIVESSNHALFVRVTRPCPDPDPEPAIVLEAIHKPTLGERPLDDFPDGTLAHREVAAWLVSEAMGWDIVPPTILRDGPFGEGMLQAYVDTDAEVDVWSMVVEDDPRLRRMATFDAAINNTDRKGGHILPVDGGRHVHGVDHGVTFSVVPKLRTVLWGWRGQPFADDELAGLTRLRDALAADDELRRELRALLSGSEVRALVRRVDGLLETGCFPYPSPTWPAVPWPPF